MKFWTTESDALVVDMIQCQECDKWIPQANLQLHLVHHQQQDHEVEEDDSIPNFVIESIPCETCHVLVPKVNWEIHRAHVCRGRRQNTGTLLPVGNEPPLLLDNDKDAPNLQLVECEDCHALVPIHNLELHETRACGALTSNRQQSRREDASKENEKEDASQEAWAADGNFVQKWKCPRCTFMNQAMQDADANRKCAICDYSPTKATQPSGSAGTTNGQLEKESNEFWQTLVGSWVPKEYHQLFPESFRPIRERKGTSRKKRTQQKQKPKLGKVPPQGEVRLRRNHHLSLLERERQQYLVLLQEAREEALRLREEGHQLTEKDSTRGEQKAEPHRSRAAATESLPQPIPSSQLATSQLELLQMTEQLCLYHLEHIRRTRLVQQLTLDIALLGLPRWRHHLNHLLDLYQSGSELYIGNIIWELRMHFMQYGVLEMLANLECAIWKEQIIAITPLNAPMSMEARRVCRNERDISVICQSVLPFLGRPLTPALRAL